MTNYCLAITFDRFIGESLFSMLGETTLSDKLRSPSSDVGARSSREECLLTRRASELEIDEYTREIVRCHEKGNDYLGQRFASTGPKSISDLMRPDPGGSSLGKVRAGDERRPEVLASLPESPREGHAWTAITFAGFLYAVGHMTYKRQAHLEDLFIAATSVLLLAEIYGGRILEHLEDKWAKER